MERAGGEELAPPPQEGAEKEHRAGTTWHGAAVTQDRSHQGLAIKPRTTPAHARAHSCQNDHLILVSRFCFPTIC